MRTGVLGPVEKSVKIALPVIGLMISIWKVAEEAFIGMRCDHPSSLPGAEFSPPGVYFAAAPSAENSRVREIAIGIRMMAMGRTN